MIEYKPDSEKERETWLKDKIGKKGRETRNKRKDGE